MKDKLEKHPFRFSYNRPVSDWFEEVKVELKHEDYYYFKLERRFGPSWWLIGTNPKENPKYHWEDKEIGQISDDALRRFIEWAKTGNGSKIIQFKCSGSHFDIIEEVTKLAQ